MHLPQRIILTATLLGLLPPIAMLFFVELHPLNTEPISITRAAFLLVLYAFAPGVMLASALIVDELRIITWLMLIPAALLLLVMTLGSVADALLIDSALRAEAAGHHHMNCGGAPILGTIILSNFVAFPTLAFSALSYGVNHVLKQFADRQCRPLPKTC